MIISKANLQAIAAVRTDKGAANLNVLYLEKDGSTYCVSQTALIAVSPVGEETRKKVSYLNETNLEDTVILNGETVNDILRNMPRDTLFQGLLEHCDVDDNAKVTLTDGKQQKEIKGIKQKMIPMPYRNVLRKMLNNKQMARSVVNLVRLKVLLEAVEKACGDQSGELPIYIEFSQSNDIIIRVDHPRHPQRVVAIMTSYKGAESEWISQDKWEKSLTGGEVEPKLKLKLKIK